MLVADFLSSLSVDNNQSERIERQPIQPTNNDTNEDVPEHLFLFPERDCLLGIVSWCGISRSDDDGANMK